MKKTSLWNMVEGEIYRLLHKRSFQATFLLMFLYSTICFLYFGIRYCFGNLDFVLNGSAIFVGTDAGPGFIKEIFRMLFPILVVIPCAGSFFDETKKVGNISFSIVRTGALHGLVAKLIAAFSGNFLIFFISYGWNLLCCVSAFGEKKYTLYGVPDTELFYMQFIDNGNIPYKIFYFTHPIWYNLLYCVGIAIFAGILGVFAYTLSLWILKRRILVYVLIYVIFFITNRYPQFFGGFSISDAIDMWGFWQNGYGHKLLYLNVALLLISGILLAVRWKKGVEKSF